ncbi:MAG: trigger factor [Patescibacteria group bacterium]
MEYTYTRLPKSEIEIFVSIPFPEFEPHVKRAAILISEQIEIEGFRKGKAPYDVVNRRVGESAIYERAADVGVRATYPEILSRMGTAGDLSPRNPVIGKPEITVTKLASGNPLEYKVRAAILPDVTLPDYKALAQKVLQDRKEQTVTDEEVAAALEWLRESRTTLVTVGRPAARGDRVEVDFDIRSEGVKIADGTSTNHPFTLGQGRFIPGFESAIEGMKKDEEKSFSLTVPADWRDASFAGKTLDITAVLKLVQERRLPDLTDEFAKGLGNFETLDAMKQNVREGILTEKREKETQRVRGAIISAIATSATIDVPDVLINAEVEKMTDELRRGVAEMGMQWPDYLLHIKKTEEDLKKEWRKEGESRVRTALVLREIGTIEKIEPSEEELATREQVLLQNLRTASSANRTIDPLELREYARGTARNEKVFDFLEKSE